MFFSTKDTQLSSTATNEVAQCGSCGLYSSCLTPCMETGGEGLMNIMVVAEANGQQEDEQGTQLVGKAGQRLEQELAKFGVNLHKDCYKINACNCLMPNNQTPTHNQIKSCRPYVMREIQRLQPHVIILLGGTALRSVLSHAPGENRVDIWRGWQIPDVDPAQGTGAWVVPTMHPSYVMRKEIEGKLSEIIGTLFHYDIQQAVNLARDKTPLPSSVDFDGIITDQNDGLDKLIEMDKRIMNSTSHAVALDYETTTLKPHGPQAEILCYALCDGYDTVSVMLNDGRVEEVLTDILCRPQTQVITANELFEIGWTREHLPIVDVELNWWWDVNLVSHILDNRPKTSSVKFRSFTRLGVPKYNEHVERYIGSSDGGGNTPNRLKEVDERDLKYYCGTDALVEFELARIQTGLMERERPENMMQNTQND